MLGLATTTVVESGYDSGSWSSCADSEMSTMDELLRQESLTCQASNYA